MLLARRRLWSATLCSAALACCLVTGSARAEGDRAAAQALFDEAVKLRDAGNVTAACPKFEESLRLDPGPGTRFNMADCYQRLGRVASAWTHFLEVLATVERQGQVERANAVRKRVRALEPRLSRLAIDAPSPVPGLEIKRDGVVVGAAQWSTPIPVDPGPHKIEATAPGYLPWIRSRSVDGEHQLMRVAIPLLRLAPKEALPDRGQTGSSPQAPIGWVIGAAGLASAGIGAAFGVIALNKKNDVDAMCPDLSNCTQQGADLNQEAQFAGNLSTGLFIAGGVLVAGGLVLVITAPSVPEAAAPRDEAATARRSTAMAPTRLSLQLGGRPGGGQLSFNGTF